MNRERTSYASTPSEFVGERQDCSVRSLAVAAQLSYAESHSLFARAGREYGKGTYTYISRDVHARTGIMEELPWERPVTLAQWLKKHPTGRYVVHVRRHAFAVVDGVVHDWGPKTSGPRRQVLRAWRVRG